MVAEREARRRLYEQRRDGKKWANAQLDAIRKLLEETKKCANSDWLQVAIEFHEVRLIKLVKRLDDKEMDDVPQELKDGVAAFVSGCAGNKAEIQESGFNFFREVWDAVEMDGAKYVRAAESAEALLAIEQLKEWTDCSVEGIAKFTDVMKTSLSSPGAQQAGLTRIGFLFSQAHEVSKSEGLSAAGLMPSIKDGMSKHLVDPDVQRYGCAALRGVAMADGQLPGLCDAEGIELIVEALKAHFKISDVCTAANGAFWAMSQVAGRNSPEVTRMRTAGVTEILLKVMNHHAWDQTLCGKVRVTLPFIQGD